MIRGGTEEIHIWINPLGSHFGLHDVLNLGGHFVKALIPRVSCNLLGERLQVTSARVVRLVDAVAEAHDPVLAGEALLDVRLHVVHGANFIEHVHHFFIGAAVQRTLQCANGRSDGAVHIAERANGDARCKGAGVQTVVGVQNQANVKCFRNGNRWARTIQHVQEVGGHVHRRIRTHQRLALAMTIKVRNDGWRLCQESHRLAPVCLGRIVIRFAVKHSQ